MAGYLDYWGKAQPAPEYDIEWHPAAYHGLDVAAVGEALLNSRPQLLAALARMSGLPEGLARSWFLFALAIHDVGKFACCFQAKVEAHFHHRARWETKPLGADPGHGCTGLALWEGGCDIDGIGARAFTPLFGSDWDAHCGFNHWMVAVAGHHGRPVLNELNLTSLICPEALADARDYIEACATLFDPHPGEAPPAKDMAMKRASWLVAGLAMLCDWVGSNQAWFPYSAPGDSLAGYWDHARARASGALDAAGLTPPTIATRFTLADALGKADAGATPLQCWAADVPVSGQSLAIIEDLTGAGKTEASLILAHRLMASGAAEGLYWALPTMATADALYHRLAKSYQRLFADASRASLVLAHSASSFNEVFAKSIFTPKAEEAASYGTFGEDEADDDDITASAACTRWLADDRRKTFLADVGIGTIDQALLGVLPSKHQALRLAALSRRVLVIDEAHSYDPYMTRLLENLLEFQGALGGSAIVMSATLTMEARRRFAEAFARGAGWQPKPHIGETGFPLATLVTEEQPAAERVLAASRGTRRDLPVRRLDDAAAAIATLKQATSDGLGAVWIRNTVQDALDGYQALRDALPEAGIDLFHARFALGDRLAIERRVLTNFGKDSEGPQRQRIVIATQVVEQSLDCDWDVMISDLAPVDLLIQRAGRLHRHDRPSRPAPLLHIVGPEPAPDAGPKWYESAFPRAAYVYPHHGQLWLTMRALLDARGLNLATQSPRDIIERVFAAEAAGIPEGLVQPSGKAEGKASSERAIANMNALALKLGYVPQAGAWESDTRTPTRLGEPSRVLRLAKWDGEHLKPWWPDEGDMRRAWRLSEVSVRAARVAGIDYSYDAALAKAVAREIAAWPEKYDPPLLVPLIRDCEAGTACGKDTNDRPVKMHYDSIRGLSFVEP